MPNPFFASPHYVVAAALPPSDKYCNFPAGMVTVFFAARLFYWVPSNQAAAVAFKLLGLFFLSNSGPVDLQSLKLWGREAITP